MNDTRSSTACWPAAARAAAQNRLRGLAVGCQLGCELDPGFGRALLVGEDGVSGTIDRQGPAALHRSNRHAVVVQEDPASHRLVGVEVATLLDDAGVEVRAGLPVHETPSVQSLAAAIAVEVGLLLHASVLGVKPAQNLEAIFKTGFLLQGAVLLIEAPERLAVLRRGRNRPAALQLIEGGASGQPGGRLGANAAVGEQRSALAVEEALRLQLAPFVLSAKLPRIGGDATGAQRFAVFPFRCVGHDGTDQLAIFVATLARDPAVGVVGDEAAFLLAGHVLAAHVRRPVGAVEARFAFLDPGSIATHHLPLLQLFDPGRIGRDLRGSFGSFLHRNSLSPPPNPSTAETGRNPERPPVAPLRRVSDCGCRHLRKE